MYEIQHIIPYCVRLSSTDERKVVEGAISSILTFEQLKSKQVTVENLRKWSSPIDVIERYQIFLQMNTSLSTELFYNCTEPWFGSFCQYKFPINRAFPDIIDITFASKQPRDDYAKFTCYILMKCNRGSPFLCLDWREICDGKIDCLDGGEDEKYCSELQTNQCDDDDEYQCRNGMCIDKAFLLETGTRNSIGYECLDQSDESGGFPIERQCFKDIRFHCEDTACSLPDIFTCGDGNCIYWPLPTSKHVCESNRDRIFNYKFEWQNHQDAGFSLCFKLSICASNVFSKHDSDIYCKILCGDMQQCKKKLDDCPSSIFGLNFPVWNGHLWLGYFTNRTQSPLYTYLVPHFICYDKHKCPHVFRTFEVGNYTCSDIKELNLVASFDLYQVFISCTNIDYNLNALSCPKSLMLRCPGTDKCIPKRHIMDGIQDCYDGFDESIAVNSCLLNDTHRFYCTNQKRCLSPVLINDARLQCDDGEDEQYFHEKITRIQQIPFSALCDSRREFSSSINDTDETDCEHWPCVNQYTRCNGVWNCPKGMDEINCPSKFNCPPDHHPCLFPGADTISCLHINRTEDGIVDCLGATDERRFCQKSYPNDETARYRCWNDSKCVDYLTRCMMCKALANFDKSCQEPDYYNQSVTDYFHTMYGFFFAIKSPFSPESSKPFPAKPLLEFIEQNMSNQTIEINTQKGVDKLDSRQAWLCNRGILVYHGQHENEYCLCSAAYYGHRCQYQSQRVSLTLRFRNKNLNKLDVIGIVVTLIDDTGFIHSYEQFTYVPFVNCNTKFNIYLLYRDRPKDMTKSYKIHIDAYDKVSLIHLRNWILPVKFLFMPVNRVSAQLDIPSRYPCHISCQLRNHQPTKNVTLNSCECEPKRSEISSTHKNGCNCSPDSVCVGTTNNRSICLCPLTKMSPRCYLDSICHDNMCMNKGLCVPHNDRSSTHFICICEDGYSGQRCEYKDVKIDISFSDISIPHSLLVHFITVYNFGMNYQNPAPIRATMFKKINFDQETITIFRSLPFHLAFTQIENKLYLIVLQHNYTRSVVISTQVSQSQYCPHIRELSNDPMINYPILRRVKYYHLLCRKHSNLVCFQDNEVFLCLCTEKRHANCFHFDFNMTYNCMGSNICQNQAQCFQDDPSCPTKILCVCTECFYGSQCQFNTEQFGISLDAILGYHIRPHLPIAKQSLYVSISIVIAAIMLAFGLISGILSIITFHSKPCQKVGSGIYLTASSITAILTMVLFNLKLWFLVLTQMSSISSRSFLLVSCISMEFMLRSLLAITDWFHACVAIERFIAVIVNINFDRQKSKKVAKLLLLLISLCIAVSFVHDPIHRRLIDDDEEKRTWCTIHLTTSVKKFNSFINIFHFITPFSLKVISAVGIIFCIANRRASVKRQQPYIKHIKQQFRNHKHLITNSSFLIVLALPRLIFAFSVGCMRSGRKPLLYLIGYFVSFIPSLLIFFVFVSTSKTYEQEFKILIRRRWNAVRHRFKRQ